MRYIFILAATSLALLSCIRQEYPKRIGDRLYITDSTFHIMDGADTPPASLAQSNRRADKQRQKKHFSIFANAGSAAPDPAGTEIITVLYCCMILMHLTVIVQKLNCLGYMIIDKKTINRPKRAKKKGYEQ